MALSVHTPDATPYLRRVNIVYKEYFSCQTRKDHLTGVVAFLWDQFIIECQIHHAMYMDGYIGSFFPVYL